jgi:hypothetical protein
MNSTLLRNDFFREIKQKYIHKKRQRHSLNKYFFMQPPPPPPPLPGQVNQASCQWCLKPMNSDAVRCPDCGKLRKDIYNEKVVCYVFCIIGGLLIGIAIALWKSRKPNLYDFYNGASPGSNSTNVILLILGIATALAGLYYYIRVSKKLNSWIWR